MTAQRSALDRFLAGIPYALAAIAVLSLLFWQAAIRKSPTIFGDELEWTQISRAIASTGHAARRGEPIGFKSLYAFLIAPLWWIHSTSTAYAAIKYVNTVVMALAAFPTYFMARMLVSARVAFVAALAALCTTGLYYAPFILPEVAAYPVFAFCAWVSIRALAGGGRRWIAAAVVFDAVAPLVRGELVIVPASAAVAAVLLWLVGPRGTKVRARLGLAGQVVAAVLLVLVLFGLNREFGHHSQAWATVSHGWKHRLWTLGMEATSALALGLGLLPFMGGLASLWLPDRRRDPAWRAFAAFTATALVATWTYTGVKAAYLSTVFATRVEERNMIYVQPLLIVGTAAWLCARRRSLAASLAAFALTMWLVLHYGYQLDYPYFEAPGYGLAAMANRSFRWTQHDIRLALAALGIVLLAAVLFVHRRGDGRATRLVLAVTSAGALALMLAGEVTSSRGSAFTSRQYADNMSQPLDWIDRAAHGRNVTYLVQDVSSGDALGLNLEEFWNRDIKHVWSLDGSAPGPGPTLTPDLLTPGGKLSNGDGVDLVLASNSIDLGGQVIDFRPGVTLREVPGRNWALRQASYGVSGDGWITGSSDDPVAAGTLAYFGPERTRGTLLVAAGRTGFCAASAPPAHVTMRVGPVALNEQRAPVVGHASFVRRFVVRNCHSRTLRFEVTPPVAVEIRATPLVHPTDYNVGDSRYLGVQVGFAFKKR